tara:strand:+ start:61 stop:174 length:114 start_codon:yes stop_codon:yes gene_type:complete
VVELAAVVEVLVQGLVAAVALVVLQIIHLYLCVEEQL